MGILDEILENLNPDWNNLEKALFVYIELEKKLGKENSLKIAQLYKKAMDQLDIPCNIIRGIEGNAWNEIMINGEYYPLDLSWDVDFFNSKESDNRIGICHFLLDPYFYDNPHHKEDKEYAGTISLIKKDTKKITSKDLEEALRTINGDYEMAPITESPIISLKSKELQKSFEKGEITAEQVQKNLQLNLDIQDEKIDDLRDDLKQISRYYPQLLRDVKITNSTKSHINMQKIVDEMYLAKKSLLRTYEARTPIKITIESDNSEDFNLDFSNAPAISITPGKSIEENASRNSIILRNTGNNTIKLPNIGNKLSKTVKSLTLENFDVSDLDFSTCDLDKLEFIGQQTQNLSSVSTINDDLIICFNSIPDNEFDMFINSTYPISRIFEINIKNQNLENQEILKKLAVNNNITRIRINSSKLNNVFGIERFNGRLGLLDLSNNNLSAKDIEKIFNLKNNTPDLYFFATNNQRFLTDIRVATPISNESIDYIKNLLIGPGHVSPSLNDYAQIINDLVYWDSNIPYYIKDAKTIRSELKIKNNPVMLENDNELNTIDFKADYLKEARLLLTISQLESLLQSNKKIPQSIGIKIDSVNDLTSQKLKDLKRRSDALGINLNEIQIIDNNFDNENTQIAPYSLSQYIYIRDTLDQIVEGIDMNEPDIDKFAVIYRRLGDSINYDHNSASSSIRDRASSLHFSKMLNTSRNLLNGLESGSCVCAGYADILRNALTMVGINCRLNSGGAHHTDGHTRGQYRGGHAWNQVYIKDASGNGKWYYTDLTWDAPKGVHNESFDYALRGKDFFELTHSVETFGVPTSESDDYDRIALLEAMSRAKQRSFDFINSRRPINIPNDPQMQITLDNDRIKAEFKKRTNDMLAKYYGNKDYQKEYLERSERFKSHEIEKTSGSITYKTIEDYPEKKEDEEFLLLDKYKECLERLTKYQAGDTSVYTGTPDQIQSKLDKDKEYVETRNNTFNQNQNTYNDLATLGKYGEKIPYIQKQQGFIKNLGITILNGTIFVRNFISPVYRGIGKYIAQPISKLIRGNKDASPYRNNFYHRMVARRDYFLEEAQQRDIDNYHAELASSSDPSSVTMKKHPIRNIIESRVNAILKAKQGNEAVLKAGAADIKNNIKIQETQKALISNITSQVQQFRQQINQLNQELISNPYASNKSEVQTAIAEKIQKMQNLEETLRKASIEGNIQTDAISSSQHAIASKEVNTYKVTVIKGVAKGITGKFVGPKIHDWLLGRIKKVKTTQIPTTKTESYEQWIPTTYKTKKTPVYQEVLDKTKSMKDMMSSNKGKQVTGFYSVYGGERRPALYNLTGNEKITAVFKSVGKGGNGLSDTAGLRAPTLTDGTFAKSLLDNSGVLRQDTTLDQLLNGLNSGITNLSELENIYVSVGDKCWVKLADLAGDMVSKVKVDEITSKVIDVAGHFETVSKVIDGTQTIQETVTNPVLSTGIDIASTVVKGGLGMDNILDVVENVRTTKTDVKSNKHKPRNYEYQDNDLDELPTSRKDYKDRGDRD